MSPRILLVSKTMVYHLIVVMYCRSHIACTYVCSTFCWVVTIADIYRSFPAPLLLSEREHCMKIYKIVQKYGQSDNIFCMLLNLIINHFSHLKRNLEVERQLFVYKSTHIFQFIPKRRKYSRAV